MKAAHIRTYGSADGIEVVELDEPRPAPDQILVRVEAIGVGGVDAVIRRGTLGARFPEGLVLGSEVAGRVETVGSDVDPSWLGRRVWAFTGVGGAYAELAPARVDDVTPLPEGLSSVDAVALGSATPVAHFALDRAGFSPGDSVLVRGGSGSLGIMTVQVAAQRGASAVAVTTSSPDRGARLRALGATRVLDRAGQDENEPGSHDVVVDVVAGPGLPAAFDLLADNGTLVTIGIVAGPPPADLATTLFAQFQRSLSYATFSLDTVPVADRNRARAEYLDAAARGRLEAVVHDVLPLDEAAEAHRRMDAGEVFGRIVLTP